MHSDYACTSVKKDNLHISSLLEDGWLGKDIPIRLLPQKIIIKNSSLNFLLVLKGGF